MASVAVVLLLSPNVNKKSNPIIGPEGSGRMRLPDFKTVDT
jgi:hypothetical protein